jgi:hypothetical protein
MKEQKENSLFNKSKDSYEVNIYPADREVDAIDDLAEIMVFDNGVIKSYNNVVANLLGCKPNTLILEHVSKILPLLGEVDIFKQDRVNPYLRFLSRIGHNFEVVSMGGSRFLSALFFIDIEYFNEHYLRIIFKPVTNQVMS